MIQKLTESGTGFKPWSGRMRDWLVKIHPSWGPLVDKIASREFPIPKQALAGSQTAGVSHVELAESLYTFVSEYINDNLYEARERVAEMGNGTMKTSRAVIENSVRMASTSS